MEFVIQYTLRMMIELCIKFNSTICYQEGRYFITWSWKSDDVELLENFDVVFGRMKSLSCRLQADKMLLQQYSNVIRSQFEGGTIELIDEQKAMGNNKLVNAQRVTDCIIYHTI